MTRTLRAASLALALAALPAAADAETFGVRLGYYTDVGEPFLGGELLFRIVPDLYFNPNVEVVLVDGGRYLTLNADAHYDLPAGARTFVWVGGGLAIVDVNPDGPGDGDTDLGVNLLAGLGARRGRVIPYVQAKVILKDSSEFVIGVGIRF